MAQIFRLDPKTRSVMGDFGGDMPQAVSETVIGTNPSAACGTNAWGTGLKSGLSA